MTTKSSLLHNNPDLILKKAVHMKTPQQNNSIDCGLFGVITLLHGLPIDDMTLFISMRHNQIASRSIFYYEFQVCINKRNEVFVKECCSAFFPTFEEQDTK
jgi:Ulp1 family protease